ncbi:unnamed protein product [Alopecurus aequalis]
MDVARRIRRDSGGCCRLDKIAASDIREWGHLPDLVTSKVLSCLVPCIRSLCAFAATCRPWRRFLVASAASTILPRIPPLILQAETFSGRFLGFSPLVISEPVNVPIADRSNILASSRGHIILLVSPHDDKPLLVIVVVDALTAAKRLVATVPSNAYNGDRYHYVFLTATHLLLFVDDIEFGRKFHSLPGPGVDAPLPPRGIALVSAMIDFHGRVLGVTDRAELLEFHFHLNAADATDQAAAVVVQLLPTTGLPDDDTTSSAGCSGHAWSWRRTRGEGVGGVGGASLSSRPAAAAVIGVTRWHWRPSTCCNNDIDNNGFKRGINSNKIWEELGDIEEHSLFVDCAGRSAVACADVAAGCGVVANRVYFLLSRFCYCFEHGQPAFQALPPGASEPDGDERWEWYDLWHKLVASESKWPPPQTWVYPRLFYGC